VADASVSFSRLIVSCTGTSDSMLPLYSAVFYLSALAIHIRGGRFFWNINLMLALVSFFVIIVYILGALPSVDFARYAPLITTAEPLSSEDSISTSPTAPDGSKAWFIGGMHEWMRVYPLSAWFYIGVESLNFCSIFVNEVRLTQILEIKL
jgi:amino acid transporter